ncbi:MAG: hypothetical protein COT81_04145 [Candidatus Buchananbacteria bacterium CG10_big_fil_rev_8_21_14_0_10_42_9]|uniref:Uncharacterized protein n=1 Tax=Candidatus Buchananbacteria bacterium CG10_big_fil_rev_8_21_14_0_10_42_9 TaxID=1974526 RepID=A0A2H0W2G9_9BACT|nr:MAG: hypothetical protein COT81_04145 [Candidatus Buchananbacteria bacterium CG10_big_fil_rev_8_21_14_0_10_42_9]
MIERANKPNSELEQNMDSLFQEAMIAEQVLSDLMAQVKEIQAQHEPAKAMEIMENEGLLEQIDRASSEYGKALAAWSEAVKKAGEQRNKEV